MSEPLLTIAIPTFNRPENLKRILEILISEPFDKFKVLISDDSTTDSVQNLVVDYQKKMRNLFYDRNITNLGFNLNVAKLYKNSQTRYIWFLCDDDLINKGAVIDIVLSLEKYQPSVAIFNCNWQDSYGRIMLAGPKKDEVYTDLESFNNYGALMRATFLSILVVESKFPIERILAKSECKDNVFIQLTLVLQLLSNNFRLVLVSCPILYRDVGFKYGEFFKFVLLDPLKAIELLPHRFSLNKFTEWMIAQLPSASLLFLSQKAGLFLYTGFPTFRTLRQVIKFYGWLSLPIFLARILMPLIPSLAIKSIYLIQLIKIYDGYGDGSKIYKKMVDRAFRDPRDTGFTDYR